MDDKWSATISKLTELVQRIGEGHRITGIVFIVPQTVVPDLI